MVRAKNVLAMLMQNFFCLGLVSVLWAIVVYSLAFGGTNKYIGNFDFAWLGNFNTPPPGLTLTIPPSLFMGYQMMFAVITPALITGAIADRLRFGARIWFLGLWVISCMPVAHWVFAPAGWLSSACARLRGRHRRAHQRGDRRLAAGPRHRTKAVGREHRCLRIRCR
jgi:Amt family ammonium transporter